MSELPPYEIREYRPGDEHAILETFNRCFAEVDPTFTPRSLEEWRWTYLENPSGWRIYLAITEDGKVISQYAGMGQRVLLNGEPAKFSQAVDSMTDPAYRRGLKKPGFFVLTGYPYAENYGGPAPDGDVVMWGLPVPPAWRIGKTYLDYELIRNQNKWVLERGRFNPPATDGREVTELTEFPDDVEALFAAFAAGRGAIGVRDVEHFTWRYLKRPGVSYKIGAVRGPSGELEGLAVFRCGVFAHDDDGLLAELMVKPGATGAASALLQWALSGSEAEGRERLTTILPDSAPEGILLQQWGFRVRPTDYFLVGRNYVKKFDMRWVYDNWYYSLGDTDLV